MPRIPTLAVSFSNRFLIIGNLFPFSLLSPTQQLYSTFDRELQAAYSAVPHFRSHLEGRPFLLLTGHKPLEAAFRRLSPPKSARQQCQLTFQSKFSITMLHTPGLSNAVANALSRPPSSSPPLNTVERGNSGHSFDFDMKLKL